MNLTLLMTPEDGNISDYASTMTTKRKHNAPSPQDQFQLPIGDSASFTSPQGSSDNPTENYPRKRIAIACNVCRFRKTRCDAAKPSCGFCTDLGIECTYRKPTVGDRAKPAGPPPEALLGLERRLAKIEARLDSTHQMTHNSSMLSPNASHNGDMIPMHEPASPRSSTHQRVVVEYLNPPSVGTPVSYDFAYRQSKTEGLTARPSLLTFRAPPYISVESWDYTAEFYDDEILAGEELCDQFDELLALPIDLSKRTTRRLQQSFVENFLRWTPIFDQNTCVEAVDHAFAGNFSLYDPSTCLTFLLLALGAISEDRSESPDNQMPGLDYFARGCQILERLALRTGSLTTLQCRVLQASYFKFAIRPMQTWNAITQGARDCMHLLTSKILERMNRFEQEALHRAFWAVSTILHELEATMKMHPIGLRHFHELVPLPQFEEEDSGFYYFLAQITLRKLLTQTLEVVGYHSGRVIYAPVVTKELRKQVREWYDHLPPVVRFPLDATPVFDSRKSFLRGQYIGLFVVLGWPSVLKIMEYGETDSPTLSQETLAVTREQAQVCIKSCCVFLRVADEQLMGRKMGTHFSLYTAYATLAILIITFNCPALSFVEETRQEHHVRNGYEILRPWSHLPLICRGLERVRIMMQQAGLADIDHVPGEPLPHVLNPGLTQGIQ